MPDSMLDDRNGGCLGKDDLARWLVAYLTEAHAIAIEDIDPDKEFAAYGLDSVDAVIMAGAFEEHFAVETDPALFLRNTNFRSLLDDLRGLGLLR